MSSLAPADKRGLVLLENPIFQMADYACLDLKKFCERLHNHLIIFAPTLSSALKQLAPSSVLAKSLVDSVTALFSLQGMCEERLPGMITAKLYAGRERVPSMKPSNPGVYSSTRGAAVSQLILASFTLAQLTLMVPDCGLGTADSLRKLAPASYSSQCKTVHSPVDLVRHPLALPTLRTLATLVALICLLLYYVATKTREGTLVGNQTCCSPCSPSSCPSYPRSGPSSTTGRPPKVEAHALPAWCSRGTAVSQFAMATAYHQPALALVIILATMLGALSPRTSP